MKIKKLTTLALASLVGIVGLGGCGNSVNANATLATMEDEVVKLGVANFMARYTQYTYDSIYLSYFGEDYWSQDMGDEGKTMEETVKDEILDTIKLDYALAAHMDDYGVEITEDDQKAIQKAAKEFIDANDKKTLKAMSATQETVEEYLRLVTIQQRMQSKIEADADTEVSDEEAAQRTFSYVEISTAGDTDENGKTTEYTEEGLADLKKQAQELADGGADKFEDLAEEQDLDVETFSYKAGEENEEMDQAVLDAADKLKEGEMSGVIEAEDAYYVVRLDSEFDKEATENKKEEIVADRQNELYEKVCKEYTDDFKFDVNEKVWSKVSFDALFEQKQVEETDGTDETDETDEETSEEGTVDGEDSGEEDADAEGTEEDADAEGTEEDAESTAEEDADAADASGESDGAEDSGEELSAGEEGSAE